MTVQAVPNPFEQDRAGSWGNLQIAYREVSIPASLAQWDVVKVMKLPAGMTIHGLDIAVSDAGAGSSTVDVGYGTDEEFAGYDAAATAALRTAAWANAKRQYFASALSTAAVAFSDSRADTQHAPVHIDQVSEAITLNSGEPSRETSQYLALACTTAPTDLAILRIWVQFEYIGN